MNMFLRENLGEKIYMQQPEGFVEGKFKIYIFEKNFLWIETGSKTMISSI